MPPIETPQKPTDAALNSNADAETVRIIDTPQKPTDAPLNSNKDAGSETHDPPESPFKSESYELRNESEDEKQQLRGEETPKKTHLILNRYQSETTPILQHPPNSNRPSLLIT